MNFSVKISELNWRRDYQSIFFFCLFVLLFLQCLNLRISSLRKIIRKNTCKITFTFKYSESIIIKDILYSLKYDNSTYFIIFKLILNKILSFIAIAKAYYVRNKSYLQEQNTLIKVKHLFSTFSPYLSTEFGYKTQN